MDCPYCGWAMKKSERHTDVELYICDNYGCTTELENGGHLKPCVVVPREPATVD